jgi:hypothetical protein
MFLLKAQEQSAKDKKKAGFERVLELEQIINTHAMGKPGKLGIYPIPVDEKEGTILDIKMDGNTSQRLLSKFDKTLIDLLMNEDESGCDNLERESWYQVFGHLQNMFEQCPNMKISQMRNLMFCRCALMTSLTFGSHCVVVM